MHISHEAIYRAIYLRKSHAVLPKGIYHCLRCCRPIRYGNELFPSCHFGRPVHERSTHHPIGEPSVSGCLCVGVGFLEVFVEVVWVGDSHLVDGLFPSGDFFAFDKAAS